MSITTIERKQLACDTAANWTAQNPILALAEIGYETDTKKQKIGDGATAWNSLAYGSDASKMPIAGSAGQAFIVGDVTATKFVTVSGTTTAAASGVPVTISSTLPAGVYLVSIPSLAGDCANYGASATVFIGTVDSRIVANNAPSMAITLGGGGVQAAQASGTTQAIPYSITRIG